MVRGAIPDNSLVVGNPAKVVCQTTEWATKKINENLQWAQFLNHNISKNASKFIQNNKQHVPSFVIMENMGK